MRNTVLLLVFCFLQAATVNAAKWEEKPEWKRYFADSKVEGCFLAYDSSAKEYSGYNLKRAKQEFSPASTFKYFNSLVFLESGVVRNADEIFKWDGVDRGNANWNRDQTLRNAFKFSTLWYFQELARKVGDRQMQRFVDRSKYGNRDIGGGIDKFWLDGGDMRITAQQEIEFLVRLHKYDLPFSRENIDTVKEISILEKTSKYVLRGKLGWSMKEKVAWLVGYVERGGKVSFFAMNVSTPQHKDADTRIPVTQSIMRELKMID